MIKKTLEMIEEGHKLLLVCENAKKPVARDWPHKLEGPAEIIAHLEQGGNIGWQHGLGTIAIDCDKREAAECVWRRFGPFRTIVKTPRGFHFICYFDSSQIGNYVNVHGMFDVRGHHGFTVCPPSQVNGSGYAFVDGYDKTKRELMTVFRSEWLPQRRSATNQPFDKKGDMVCRAVLWTNAIPGEAEGNRDNKCFYVACKLIRSFELSVAEAWPILLSFNARCKPPLTNLRHLKRKLYEAQKRINHA